MFSGVVGLEPAEASSHLASMTTASPPLPASRPARRDPFFEVIPDGLWNACIGVQGSEEDYVDGYLEAARELVAAVLDKRMFGSRDSLAMPILYNCRHALELSLKFVIDHLHQIEMIAQRHKADHDIKSHWTHLRDAKVGDARLVALIDQLEPFVGSLAAIDDDGQELRYSRNRAGDKSLGGFAVVNLPHIQRSIDALGAILEGLKRRVVELEEERLTGAHTGECSREDLKVIAGMVGPHSDWGEPEFQDRKTAVMAQFDLGSRKFSHALTAIRQSRPLATLVGIETPLTYLSDEKALAAARLWADAYPAREVDPEDTGTSFFDRDFEALEAHAKKTQGLVEAISELLDRNEFADLETLYYLGRNRDQGEHYGDNLARTARRHALAKSRWDEVHHIMTKTNLLDSIMVGAREAGRPSLAAALRAIRPG